MDIDYIKRRLLVKYSPFGSIIANTCFISDKLIETAATDGDNIYYNPDFLKNLTADEQIFVFAHELGHIGYNHIERCKDKDPEIWNMAADGVLNANLKKDGLPLIKGAIDIPYAGNYDVEELYQKLLQEKKEQKENTSNQTDNQEQSNNQNNSETKSNSTGQSKLQKEINKVGHDTHELWSKAYDKNSQNNEPMNDSLSKQKKETINKLTELGEREGYQQNRIEYKKRLEELRESLVNESHGYGNKTNSDKITISDIGIANPLLDWRKLLKEAIKYDVDWSYQNASIEDGILTAHLEELPNPETEILLDTSGSINKTLLRNFLRECKNILSVSKVKVGCFDTKFYGFSEIKNITDIDNLSFSGGGGTNFEVAINAFSKRVENKVIFTDGASSMPNTPMDAIWVVFGNRIINPAGGRVIYINNEQLDRLCTKVIINDSNTRKR